MFSQAIDSPQPQNHQNSLRDLPTYLNLISLENTTYHFLKFRALFLLAVKMNNMNNGYINHVLMYIPVNKVTFYDECICFCYIYYIFL